MSHMVAFVRVRPDEMMAVNHRGLQGGLWVDLFLAEEWVTDPEQQARDAVAEFLATTEGREAIDSTSQDFNWGDAMIYVPANIWQKHGLLPPYDTQPATVILEQDEVLCK